MKPLRIMLVDDHEVVRLGLKALLNHYPNFNVIAEATTADEAVNQAFHHELDVILMDIRLAQGSGIEACQRIKARKPDIHVLMLTSYAEDEMLFAAIRAGASGYVLKQVGSVDLVRAIEGAAKGESTLDPSLTEKVLGQVRQAIQKEEQNAFAELSSQELQALNHIMHGKTNREIAKALHLSQGTVRNYVSNIFSKLGVANRAEAAAYAVKYHLSDFL